jgi:hypothetical protein
MHGLEIWAAPRRMPPTEPPCIGRHEPSAGSLAGRSQFEKADYVRRRDAVNETRLLSGAGDLAGIAQMKWQGGPSRYRYRRERRRGDDVALRIRQVGDARPTSPRSRRPLTLPLTVAWLVVVTWGVVRVGRARRSPRR